MEEPKLKCWKKNGTQDWVRRKKDARSITGFAEYDEGYFTNDLKAKFEIFGKKPETEVFSKKQEAIDWLHKKMKKNDTC